MLKSLYTAATGMHAQQTKMDVIANNLANAGTTGFKKARAEFEDLLSEQIRPASAPRPEGGQPAAPLEVGQGVRTASTTRNFGQGDLVATNNPLDVAIEGEGFFRVLRPDGEVSYTRAGNFKIDATGRLVTAGGNVVTPPITFPQDVTDVAISPDGTVKARTGGRDEMLEMGRIELATFVNPAGLEAMGGNLLRATEASGPALVRRPGEDGLGGVTQGFLESSNVKAVEEMIDMIVTQRAYEMNSKVVQTADDMLGRLTNLR